MKAEEDSQVDPWSWAFYNALNLDGEPFQRVGHEYLMDYMQDRSQVKTVRKATQAGYTLATIVMVLHLLKYGREKNIRGVLYIFPTADEVYGFSQSRFGPLIQDNPFIRRMIHPKDVNNAMVKRVGKSTLYFAGGRMTQRIGGLTNESAALRSKPVDVTVFDEKDLMDLEVDAAAESRMAHSWLMGRWNLSNPTIPGYGIDKDFQNSDQRYWGYRCGCGTYTIPLEEYDRCVHIDKENKGYLACTKCGRRLVLDEGMWIKKRSENKEAGWQWSHFESQFFDPAKLVQKLENAVDGTEKQKVYNYDFGLPYIPVEDRLTVQDVYDCCGNDPVYSSSKGPCAMGVDVGNILHVVIGQSLGGEKCKILWMGTASDFNDLHDLAARYGVEAAVIDIGPEGHSVRGFQAQEPYVVFSCRYQDRAKTVEKLDSDAGMLVVDKTATFDLSRELFVKKKVELPRQGPAIIDEYARQCCNAVRLREELNEGMVKRTHKQWVYRYRALDADHFRSATNYFMLACKYVKKADLPDYPFDRLKKNRNEYTKEFAFK